VIKKGGGSIKISVKRKDGTVAVGMPERQVRKASHCGNKQQFISHALIMLVGTTYTDVILRAHPVCGESHIQHNTNGGVASCNSNKEGGTAMLADYWCPIKRYDALDLHSRSSRGQSKSNCLSEVAPLKNKLTCY